VAGGVSPETVNNEPATEILEIVTGAVPVAVRTNGFVAYCPTVSVPKSMLVVLIPRVGVPAFGFRLMRKVFETDPALAVIVAV